jgi:hypothetical protein
MQENMATQGEVKKRLESMEKERETEGPFTGQQNITRKAAKQALLCVLKETDNLLTY